MHVNGNISIIFCLLLTEIIFSWTLAGIGCLFSAASYTELSGHVPVEGGAYAYAYHTIGELPAVVVAWLLTLEYGLSGAGNCSCLPSSYLWTILEAFLYSF